MGLSITKELTERLGGKIWFESEPNKGTEFFIAFPQEILVTEKADNVIIYPNNKEEENWVDKTILIVEDDEMSYIFLKEILKGTRANLLHAKTGNKALELANTNQQIDLVLMDIKLPDISGYEVTSLIKKSRDIPVIAQTAFAMADDHKKCIEVGCDDYLSKPINRKKLLQSIAIQFHKNKDAFLN